MSYNRGHCTGHKKHRTPRRATQARLQAMAAEIQRKLEGKTVQELLTWHVK